jgi:hypothetical protein
VNGSHDCIAYESQCGIILRCLYLYDLTVTGVNDYGGPYRAVFEQIVDELQADAVTVGVKVSASY